MLALAQAAASQPLPCPSAPVNDTEPWRHNAAVLGSFPPGASLPRAIGEFRDRTGQYWLKIWRDREGVFGELSHPVLEADSPTSRLHDVRWEQRSRRLSFTARLPGGELRVSGRLGRAGYQATLIAPAGTRTLHLRKVKSFAQGWTSRAQFECAMDLFHRF